MKELTRDMRHMNGPSAQDALLRHQAHALLAQHALTKGCSPDARNALCRAAEWRFAARDQVLAREGDPVASLGLICKGTLRLHRKASGTRVVGYRPSGDALGEESLGGSAVQRYSAVAMQEATVLCLPTALIGELLASEGALRKTLFAWLVAQNRDLEDRLLQMRAGTVEQRLAFFLRGAAARCGTPAAQGTRIEAPFTHSQIADVVGSSRETITATLSSLRKEGVLITEGRRIVVVDVPALAARAADPAMCRRVRGRAGVGAPRGVPTVAGALAQ